MARKQQPPPPKKPAELEAEVRALLEQRLRDEELRSQLEALAAEPAFNGLTYLWGPELYRRNRVRFRPFILNHFGQMFQIGWDWKPVRWKDHAAVLDAWLEEVDRRDDVELFRRLYPWKHSQNEWGGVDDEAWRRDLLARFQAAKERPERNQVLNKFDLRGVSLDEPAALTLYQIDPPAARPFILKHAPGGGRWVENRELPEKLCEAARQRGDEDLYFALYRRMVPQKTWEKDVAAVAKEVAEPQRMLEELEKRHPNQSWDLDLQNGFYTLAKARGREIVPYLMKHMDSLWVYGWFGGNKQHKLLEHARDQGWWDVWSVLVRKADNDQYNKEVLTLVEDRKQPEEVLFRRLVMLSGASSEWNWGRFAWQQIQYLPKRETVPLGWRIAVRSVVSKDRRFVRVHLDANKSHLDSAEVDEFQIRHRDQKGKSETLTHFIYRPKISKLAVNRKMAIPDGKTAVLATGYKQQIEGRNEYGTPILSNLPLLGRLFRTVGYYRQTLHLVVLVTPRILVPQEKEETHSDEVAGIQRAICQEHLYDNRTPILGQYRENDPHCPKGPDEARVLRALPPVKRLPGIYEESRDKIQIVTEPIVDKIDPPCLFPLVGTAQLHRCHWKCTVYYNETITGSYPTPFRCSHPRVHVVNIDADHLHRVAMERPPAK
jgi:hypothetical protein